MQKIEYVYREILYQRIEKKKNLFTQASLASTLQLSLSTVNHAIRVLSAMGAVEIRQRSFIIIDVKKVLYYWASLRDLHKDCVYATRVEQPVVSMEKLMPADAVFGAYTAYKFLFHDVPADYSEMYVYGNIDEIQKRFPFQRGVPNLFVLKKDALLEKYGRTTPLALTFVDLWNLKEWYAKEFITALEARLHGILE